MVKLELPLIYLSYIMGVPSWGQLLGSPLAVAICAFCLGDQGFAFFRNNLYIQLLIFLPIAFIPCYITRKMMWVDIAWPWGLFAIGCQLLVQRTGLRERTILIATSFVVCGLRMGVPALFIVPRRSVDFNRYEYAKIRWESEGLLTQQDLKRSVGLNQLGCDKLARLMLFDASLQMAANTGVCFLPGLLLAFDPSPLDIWDLICHFGFWVAFGLEGLADFQKIMFAYQPRDLMEAMRALRGGFFKTGTDCVDRSVICDTGLWSLSRHPNYFGEWLVWISYALAAVGAIHRRRAECSMMLSLLSTFLLFLLVFSMYNCLVYWTGIEPAEYFSLQHRQGYADYQRRVSRFVPKPTAMLSSLHLSWSSIVDSVTTDTSKTAEIVGRKLSDAHELA